MQLSKPVEREGGETARLRRVINRIAAQVGHPPIASGELGIESVAEAVERHAAHAREREEALDSITPQNLRAFAASEAHHDEHHEREKELEAQLAEANARGAEIVGRAVKAQAQLEQAEARAADLERVLTNVEAYMASESGPLYHLWENCDIGDYDDYQTEWEQTLFDLRDWKNGCVPAASVGGGTEWPEVLLYREVLAALNPDKREEGEADNA